MINIEYYHVLRDTRTTKHLIDILLMSTIDQKLRALPIAAKDIFLPLCGK